jgi:hypothetical protein
MPPTPAGGPLTGCVVVELAPATGHGHDSSGATGP